MGLVSQDKKGPGNTRHREHRHAKKRSRKNRMNCYCAILLYLRKQLLPGEEIACTIKPHH